jgi:hypothetical protein
VQQQKPRLQQIGFLELQVTAPSTGAESTMTLWNQYQLVAAVLNVDFEELQTVAEYLQVAIEAPDVSFPAQGYVDAVPVVDDTALFVLALLNAVAAEGSPFQFGIATPPL